MAKRTKRWDHHQEATPTVQAQREAVCDTFRTSGVLPATLSNCPICEAEPATHLFICRSGALLVTGENCKKSVKRAQEVLRA